MSRLMTPDERRRRRELRDNAVFVLVSLLVFAGFAAILLAVGYEVALMASLLCGV